MEPLSSLAYIALQVVNEEKGVGGRTRRGFVGFFALPPPRLFPKVIAAVHVAADHKSK